MPVFVRENIAEGPMISITNSEYRVSFVVGGLFRNESIEAARLFQQMKDWDGARGAMVNSGTLAFEQEVRPSARCAKW
jgi:hypothetical protein